MPTKPPCNVVQLPNGAKKLSSPINTPSQYQVLAEDTVLLVSTEFDLDIQLCSAKDIDHSLKIARNDNEVPLANVNVLAAQGETINRQPSFNMPNVSNMELLADSPTSFFKVGELLNSFAGYSFSSPPTGNDNPGPADGTVLAYNGDNSAFQPAMLATGPVVIPGDN